MFTRAKVDITKLYMLTSDDPHRQKQMLEVVRDYIIADQRDARFVLGVIQVIAFVGGFLGWMILFARFAQ